MNLNDTKELASLLEAFLPFRLCHSNTPAAKNELRYRIATSGGSSYTELDERIDALYLNINVSRLTVAVKITNCDW